MDLKRRSERDEAKQNPLDGVVDALGALAAASRALPAPAPARTRRAQALMRAVLVRAPLMRAVLVRAPLALVVAVTSAGCGETAPPSAASSSLTPSAPTASQPASASAAPNHGADSGANRAADPVADRSADVDALIRAFTPPPKDVTSDVADVWIRARKAALLAHVAPDPSLGEACWTAYRERSELGFDVRRDLLEVAAHTAPDALRDRLAAEFDAYGAEIGLRSRAIELLGELDAPRALALLEPLVVEPRKQKTYPPQETLLHAWNEAALRVGIDRTAVLARVAADLLQDDAARHLAVRQLGTCDGVAAAQTLEAVLVESTGNGYLRRLAAQSLAGNKKFGDRCATLTRVLERESDENFAQFLDDLVAKSCR